MSALTDNALGAFLEGLTGHAFGSVGLLAEATTKFTLLVALGLLVVRAMGHLSAARRHAVLAWSLAAGLLLPFAGYLAPPIPVPLVPETYRQVYVVFPAEAILASQDVPDPVVSGPEASNPVPAPETGVATAEILLLAFLAIWALGVPVFLGRIGLGVVGAMRLARRAFPIADAAQGEVIADIARRMGIRRSVDVRVGAVDVPMVVGAFRTCVILPLESDAWTEDRLRFVLAHELAHVARRDGLVQLVVSLVCATHWFNPLAWAAASRMRLERERACDDRVLEQGQRPSSYAAHLVAIARSIQLDPTGALAMAHPSQIEQRLRAILDPHVRRDGPSWASRLVIGATAVATLVVTAGVEPWAKSLERLAPIEALPIETLLAFPAHTGSRTLSPVAPPQPAGFVSAAPVQATASGRHLDAPGQRPVGHRLAMVATEGTDPDAVRTGLRDGDTPRGGSLLFLGPKDLVLRSTDGRRLRADDQLRLVDSRFSFGLGAELVHPTGVMTKTSKGLRLRGTYEVDRGTALEMTFGYAPLRIEGEFAEGDGEASSYLYDTQDQFTVGLGVRKVRRPEAIRSVYWSLVGGLANVPGRALVKSSESATRTALDSKWGYFVQPRFGLVFVAKEMPALSLDVSAGLDIISWSQFSAIQQTFTFGLNYSL